MAGPWEKYAQPAAEAEGPWARYAAPSQPAEPGGSAMGAGLRGVVRGATFGFADELRAGTDALAQGAGNLFRGAEGRPTMGETYDQSLAGARETFRQDDAAHPNLALAGQLAGGVGTALLSAPAAGAVGLSGIAARAVPLLARLNPLARTAGTGAVGGATSGFGEGEGGLGSRAYGAGVGAAIGAGVGAGVGAATSLAGRVISPVRPNLSPEARDLVDAARREGIPLSVGQESGSRLLKNIEGALAQAPGSAGPAADAILDQQRAFNRAVLRRAGENEDIASPDVLNRARARIGGVIEQVANRNTLQVTPNLQSELAQIEGSLQFLPAEAAGPVRARIEQLRGMMIQPPSQPGGLQTAATNPTIPGAAYRLMDSQLGRSIRSTTNGDLRSALGELRERLRGAMDQSISPADAATWQQARREYANLMVAADAAKGAGAATAEGHISPLALRTALDRSTGGGYVWGRGDLNELARVGQSALRQPPDSGTAGRGMATNLVTGSLPAAGAVGGYAAAGPLGAAAGAAAPFVVPRAVQSFMDSRAGRAWLMSQAGANLHGPLVDALAGSSGSATSSAATSDRQRALARALALPSPR